MTIYDFLQQLEADPFNPDIIALFDSEAAHHAAEANHHHRSTTEKLKLMREIANRNDARCKAHADAQGRT